MSFKYFIDPQYKKVKISYFTYKKCKERNDDDIYWTKIYQRDGYGQYEFFKFIKKDEIKGFTLLDNHIKVCYYCLKTYKYNQVCGYCEKFNFQKNFQNFKIVLQQMIFPKIYWDNFLKTDYSCKYKYYRDLKRYSKRVFDNTEIQWYITFYKGMPDWTIVMSRDEVSKLYPEAKNWYDVENYM